MAVYKRFAQAAISSGATMTATFAESTPLDSTHSLVAVVYGRTTAANISNSWGATALSGSGNNGSIIYLGAYLVRGDGVRNGITITFGSDVSAAAVSLYGLAGYVSLSPDVGTAANFSSGTSTSVTATGTVASNVVAIAAVALSGGSGGFNAFTDGFTAPTQDSGTARTGIKAYTSAGEVSAPGITWTTARYGRMAVWSIQGTESGTTTPPTPTRQGDLLAGSVLPTYYVGSTAVTMYQGTNQLTPTATSSTAPLAEWRFSEASAPFMSTAGDLPLTQARSTLATRVTTPFGTGIDLGGSSYLRLAPESAGRLNIGASGKSTVTVATWAYITDTGTGFLAGCWQEDNNDPRRQYGLFHDLGTYGGASKSNFHVSKTGGPTPGYPYSRDYAASGQNLTRGTWQLHVGTYDGTEARSYLNGAFVSYPTYTDNMGATYAKNPYVFTEGLNATPCEFTVGAVTLTSGPGNYTIAQLARVRVWDRCLSAAEVSALYEAERTVL